MESPQDSEQPARERRSVPRKKVLLVARLERRGDWTPVRLTDLSERGSAVAGEVPDRHCTVTLHRDGVPVRSRVAWAANGRCGLDFHEQVDLVEVLNAVGVRRPLSPTPCRRPALANRAPTATELQSIERCADLLGIALPGRG